MSRNSLAIGKWTLFSSGVLAACISIFVIFTPITSAATAMAQCGADSYVDCTGGTYCTAVDDVGCTCYNAKHKVVSRHSCSEADPGGDEELIED
jgi:hypothetical protein